MIGILRTNVLVKPVRNRFVIYRGDDSASIHHRERDIHSDLSEQQRGRRSMNKQQERSDGYIRGFRDFAAVRVEVIDSAHQVPTEALKVRLGRRLPVFHNSKEQSVRCVDLGACAQPQCGSVVTYPAFVVLRKASTFFFLSLVSLLDCTHTQGHTTRQTHRRQPLCRIQATRTSLVRFLAPWSPLTIVPARDFLFEGGKTLRKRGQKSLSFDL